MRAMSAGTREHVWSTDCPCSAKACRSRLGGACAEARPEKAAFREGFGRLTRRKATRPCTAARSVADPRHRPRRRGAGGAEEGRVHPGGRPPPPRALGTLPAHRRWKPLVSPGVAGPRGRARDRARLARYPSRCAYLQDQAHEWRTPCTFRTGSWRNVRPPETGPCERRRPVSTPASIIPAPMH